MMSNKNLLEKFKLVMSKINLESFTEGDIVYEVEALEVGKILNIVGEGGNTPVPAGEYTVHGKIIVTDDTGAIIEVKEVAVEPTPDPAPAPTADVMFEEIKTDQETIKTDQETLKAEHTNLAQTVTELGDMLTTLVDVMSKFKLEATETPEVKPPEVKTEIQFNKQLKANDGTQTTKDRVFERLFGTE